MDTITLFDGVCLLFLKVAVDFLRSFLLKRGLINGKDT